MRSGDAHYYSAEFSQGVSSVSGVHNSNYSAGYIDSSPQEGPSHKMTLRGRSQSQTGNMLLLQMQLS